MIPKTLRKGPYVIINCKKNGETYEKYQVTTNFF